MMGPTPWEMLEMRLRFLGTRGQLLTFGGGGKGFRVCAVEELPTQVIVFAINEGEPITLTDEREMFPSDKLISKIKLLTA